ncbi:MAG: NADH-quinone oxidoreductase subunit H [Candidatus Omnitrophota bacterium]
MRDPLVILQALVLIAVSPLVTGFIRKLKNFIRLRKGPGVFQPYYDLAKLLRKEEAVSRDTSWVFTCTPYIVLGTVLAALFMIPAFGPGISFDSAGDLVALVFLLALGRFFIALAGLDAGSSFGGMGSSREMFISSLVEPVVLLAVFAVSLAAGSTTPRAVASVETLKLSSLVAAGALFVVTLAETSRIPVDNRETHLELTMVHEAMVLEYSGRSLALIELASHIKQVLFYSVIAAVAIPFGNYAAKMAAIAIAVAVLEVSMAKMRLFRVVDLMSFSFVLSVIAVVISAMGF